MRTLKVLLITAILLALLAGGFFVVLKTSDLSQYRVPLQNFVQAETGRSLRIDGDFEPVISLTPAIRATNVHFANAAWADSDEMARIDEIYLQIQLWSLVSGPLRVTRLEINNAELSLERGADGQVNWSLKDPKEADSAGDERARESFIALKKVDVNNLKVTYLSAGRDKPVHADIRTLNVAARDMRTNDISVDAILDGKPVRASGTIPRLSRMIDGTADHDLEIRYGDLRLSSQLKIARLDGLEGLDGTVDVTGDSLESATSLLGLEPLDKDPFELSTTLKENDGSIAFEGTFKGQTGTLNASGSARDWSDALAIQATGTLKLPDVLPLAKYFDLPLEESGPLNAKGGVSWDPGKIGFSGFEATFDDNVVNLDGDLGLPVKPENTTLRVRSKGPNIAETMALLGRQWRITYDYEFSADFGGKDGKIVMDPVSVRLGESDFSGRVVISPGEKPDVDASLKSKTVLLGKYLADRRLPDVRQEKSERIFTKDPFDFSALDAYNLNAKLEIERVEATNTDMQDVSLDIVVQDGDLQIEPFQGSVNGGLLTGRVRLDRSGAAPSFQIELQGDNMRYAKSHEVTPEQMPLLPPNTLETRVKASGNSFHEMAVAADGWIKIVSEAGRRPQGSFGLMTNDVLTEVYYKLIPTARKKPFNQLGCGIYYIKLNAGEAILQPFLLQTDTITIRGHGKLKLDNEELDIDFGAKPRKGVGVGVASIASPFLRVRGTLANPRVGADVAGGVVSGAAAFFTMGLSVVGKGLLDRATGGRDLCEDTEKILKKYRAGEETDAIWEE